MKRFIFNIILICATLPIIAQPYKIDDLYYNLEGTSAIVSHKAGDEATGNVIIPSKFSYIDNIYTVTTIEESAFNYCKALSYVFMPNTITTIGSAAFENSTVDSVKLSDSITTIGNNVFYGCTNLTEIVLPSTLSSIGDFIFNGSGITSVTIKSTTIPTTTEKTFKNFNTTNVTLYVPFGCKSIYESDDVWGTFGSIIELKNENEEKTAINVTNSSPLSISVNGKNLQLKNPGNNKISIYSILGECLYKTSNSQKNLNITIPYPGVYIVSVDNKTTKILIK